MNWRIHVTSTARKQLKRLPKQASLQIEKIITEMEISPFRRDIEKLGGTDNTWRRRVGSYRLIYEIEAEKRTIEIYEIARRTSKTY